jgi:hypothetical protein
MGVHLKGRGYDQILLSTLLAAAGHLQEEVRADGVPQVMVGDW